MKRILAATAIAGPLTWRSLIAHFERPAFGSKVCDYQVGNGLADWGTAAAIGQLEAAAVTVVRLGHGRIAVGDIVFDRESRRVWCAGREVSLTPHEYGVVDCLFWHAPKPVGVDTLADFVWGVDATTCPENRRTLVQVYVSYVRKKLAQSAQVAIRFARGAGYEFAPAKEPAHQRTAG